MLNKKIILLSLSIILFAVLGHTASAQEATIHGAVYEWDSFDPLEHVIVEVNSTPSQSMLANYGIYSFKLDPGTYLISASYYSANELAAYTEEEITITDDGDYVLDLILYPVYYNDPLLNENDFAELDDIANFSESDKEGSSYSMPESSVVVTIVLLVLVIAGVLVILILKQKKDASTSEDSSLYDLSYEYAPEDSIAGLGDLPEDLREVISIIVKNDGRITQKDLRTKVKHSEAKVSLMVSDLESRGIVRKFKKGRGNIIILEDPDLTDNVDSGEEVTESSDKGYDDDK
ncbi:winged helix-turn-helix transcriptional regulator [Methanolobus sediminis]|uniref:Winged helix-turn-helix transcriptional regulator n=1 Tax=Methanolobus sediminis TaxID=3072978 RepID=A0AA51UKZ8_9EURY|nr:winged helix-turn-helix transcriptional regulator [Methanolobus sediminis]WMW25494.1 winged helix-turn-helix transcriptional regulator [Methanolobus sediminis]